MKKQNEGEGEEEGVGEGEGEEEGVGEEEGEEEGVGEEEGEVPNLKKGINYIIDFFKDKENEEHDDELKKLNQVNNDGGEKILLRIYKYKIFKENKVYNEDWIEKKREWGARFPNYEGHMGEQGMKMPLSDDTFGPNKFDITEIDVTYRYLPVIIIEKNIAIVGGKKHSKKEILGKSRCIYKIKGDRKEYVKHKGKLITIKDYKAIIKAKSNKPTKQKKMKVLKKKSKK